MSRGASGGPGRIGGKLVKTHGLLDVGLPALARTRRVVLLVGLLLVLTSALTACTSSEPAGTTRPAVQTSVSNTATTPPGPATTRSTSATSGFQTQSARLSPSSGAFSTCQDCHAYLDVPGKVPATLTKNFSHVKHLQREGVQCSSCHVEPVHRVQGIRKPLMADCFGCHAQTTDAKAPGRCDLCHPPDFRKVPSTHTVAFRKGGHPKVAEEQGRQECVICHGGTPPTLCRGCHGLDLPHPAGWVGTGGESGTHAQAAHDSAKQCAVCHHNRLDRPGGCYGGDCHGT